MYKTSCGHMLLFFLGKERGMGLLGHMLSVCLREAAKLLSRAAAPFFIPAGSGLEFQLLCIFYKRLVLSLFNFAHSRSCLILRCVHESHKGSESCPIPLTSWGSLNTGIQTF